MADQLALAEDTVVIDRADLEELVYVAAHPRSPSVTTGRRHLAISRARLALAKLTRRSA